MQNEEPETLVLITNNFIIMGNVVEHKAERYILKNCQINRAKDLERLDINYLKPRENVTVMTKDVVAFFVLT